MDKTVFPDEPSLWMCIDEAAVKFDLPDLQLAIDNYLRCTNHSSGRQVEVPSSSKRIQVWTKVQVQQPNYHNRSSVEPPQSLSVSPPIRAFPRWSLWFCCYQWFRPKWLVIRWSQRYVSQSDTSDTHHFIGHTVVQLCIIFCLLWSDWDDPKAN